MQSAQSSLANTFATVPRALFPVCFSEFKPENAQSVYIFKISLYFCSQGLGKLQRLIVVKTVLIQKFRIIKTILVIISQNIRPNNTFK